MGNKVAVLSGLNKGERVVTQGAYPVETTGAATSGGWRAYARDVGGEIAREC